MRFAGLNRAYCSLVDVPAPILQFQLLGAARLRRIRDSRAPDAGAMLRGSFIPTIHFNKDFLAMVVVVIGTSVAIVAASVGLVISWFVQSAEVC